MNIETTDNSPLLQECIEELISSKIDEGKRKNRWELSKRME